MRGGIRGRKMLCCCAGSECERVSLWNQPYRDSIAEDYVSARALLKDFPGMDGKMLEDAAQEGNADARHAWRQYSADLYQILQAWKNRLGTEVIVVGGQLRKGLFLGKEAPEELNICFSELGEDAALWGAYEVFLRSEKDKTNSIQ